MLDTFDKVHDDVVQRLTQAARDRKSAMHTPAVVTSDAEARVMVLRGFDTQEFSLRFHTDIRAPKVTTINADPAASVLFYDKSAKIQIRAKGTARIEHDTPAVEDAWQRGSNFARRCYLGDGPGASSDVPTSGLPSQFEGVEPTDEQLLPARENFAILVVELNSIDWLYLAHTGHVRAQLKREGNRWSGHWVSP